MFQTVSSEIEFDVPASRVWEFYATLELANLVGQHFSDYFQDIEIVEGDGGVGTVLKIVLPPGRLEFSTYKEKFTKLDKEKMLKETEVIEGGYLDMGFTLYRYKFEIIEKSEGSCITKASIEYELKEEFAANESIVDIKMLTKIMEVAANHLLNNKG